MPMFRFTIRDLLWLTAVIALIVVWRADLARQEAVYRDSLRLRMGDYSSFSTLVAAVEVFSRSSCVWAVERKPASNWDGAK